MIKRLRLKFVAINMTLVTLLLCVILGLVYYSTAADLETDSINMLRSVALNPPRPAPGEAAEDVQLPFFAVLLGPDGGIAEAAGGYFDLTDTEALAELVSEAVGSPGDIGVVPGRALRFYRADLPGRYVIVFADISSEQATLAGLVRTCAVIGALGFLAFLALSVALSRWAVRPVEKAWREQKDFVAAASHELKTPLTVIMTSAELAAPSRQTERIQSAAGRMKALIEQLLALARAENEGERAGGGPACLSAAAENAVMEFEPLCFESGHALTSEIAPGINVRGDAAEFTQLAEILLDNAVKYSRPRRADSRHAEGHGPAPLRPHGRRRGRADRAGGAREPLQALLPRPPAPAGPGRRFARRGRKPALPAGAARGLRPRAGHRREHMQARPRQDTLRERGRLEPFHRRAAKGIE